MKTIKVSSWLPLFSGFYETIWKGDSDEEMEVENINELRKEKGLPPITWDDVDWNYDDYNKKVVTGVTDAVAAELKHIGMANSVKLERLYSPREYNFSTDVIYVEYTFTLKNQKTIAEYLEKHKVAFSKYVKYRYTSYDGFISRHSNNVSDWLESIESTLKDDHKAGAVLDFILRKENQLSELAIYEDLNGNGVNVQASNYSELVGA